MAGGDLGRTTESVKGLHLHQLGQGVELQDAALDVAVEQQRQDFAGDITADATMASANGRMGQTNQRGTVVGAFEDSLSSIGAPRRTRLRLPGCPR